ncbi:reverse transcriptase [Corchorus capsularis]|uniref:Reverse transcriptase n=1 Tax=Corchorus capsularis TaxID=210143 RepID=A0A1R3GUS6_COCAP|nr:reverse transcriptase [Corchorus capsularis]
MKKIADIQDNDGSVESYKTVENLVTELKEMWTREEQYWFQRSRIKWLREGDANTNFFHQTTVERKQFNKILSLKAEDGSWIEKEKDIVSSFEQFYSELFTSNGSKNWDQVLLHVPKKVTDQMNEDMVKEVSDEEIKEAAFELGATKAPGPDGHMLHEVNNTNIVLIPKTKNPESVTQFRPISLCNFVYKIISKVLTNRLKPIMDLVITQEQGAFVGERQIQDNILIASETFHFLKLKKKGRNYDMGLKLDMNKAYDRVEWGFLAATLEKLGFCSKWIKWIMECLSTISYTLVINGKPSGRVFPSRGLRQGDPISPYLFLFVVDVLSRMVHSAVSVGVLNGIKLSRNCPPLTHLLFADDSLFFLAATKENCAGMDWILKAYCDASGQMVNLQKSSIVFSSNTPAEVRSQIEDALQIPGADNPGRKILEEHMRWQVINGQSVNLWKDRWIPECGAIQQHHEIWRDNLPVKVAEIMDKEEGVWKLEEIKSELHPNIIRSIEKLPICYSNEADRMVWPHNKDGSYTVRSGYFAIKESCPLTSASTSSSHQARCAACFEKKGLIVETVIFLAERAALELMNAKEYRDALVKCRKKVVSATHWEPPEDGRLKLNCDGAYEESTGMAAIGVVLRDEHGIIRGGVAKQMSVSSSIEAEALAVKEPGEEPCPIDPWIVVPDRIKMYLLGSSPEKCYSLWTGDFGSNNCTSIKEQLQLEPYIRMVGMEETNEANSRGLPLPHKKRWLKNLRNLPQIKIHIKPYAPRLLPLYLVMHDDVKKAVACLLFGGARKLFGKGSSAAGLTASIIRDSSSREFHMVLADGGVVCIGEFDKMRPEDRVAIHEAMEQQTIYIAKAGITTVPNSRTWVLAAANPPSGHYDDLKTAQDNIDLQTTILS